MKHEDKKSMIIDLLDNVLQNNSFRRVPEIEEQCFVDYAYTWNLYVSEDDKKEQYLVLVNIMDNGKEMLEKITKQQSRIYVELKDKLKANFDKNVSMLICVKIKEDERKKYESIILNVEEDCFYFKKLVMLYEDAEIEEIEQILSSKQLNMWEYMQGKLKEIAEIKEDDLFFAELEKIVPRIYIKLPFIQLNIRREEERKNLFEEIKESMKKEDVLLSIWNQVENIKEDDIGSFELKNDEKLDEILKQWLPEEKKDEV